MAAEPDERDWLVVRVQSPSEESSPWLAEGLIAFGATAVQEDAAWLVAWFRQPQDPDAFEARVERDMRSRCADRAVRLDYHRQHIAIHPFGGEIEQMAIRGEEPLRAELQHFVDCVQGREIPLVSGEDGLHVLEIAHRLLQQMSAITPALTLRS